MLLLRVFTCLLGLLIPLEILAQPAATPIKSFKAKDMHYAVPVANEDMGAVNGVIWSPDGSRILSTSQDGGVRIWEVATGKLLFVFPGHTDGTVRANWSPDGSRVVTASANNTARIWNANTGALEVTLSGHTAPLWAANWSPDGSRIVTASEDSTAIIWDASDGRVLFTLSGHFDTVRGARWSPDGLHIATASNDGTAMIWDANTGEPIFTLIGHDQTQRLELARDTVSVISAIWSPDGSRLVTSGTDNQAIIWDTTTGKILFHLVMDSPYVLFGQWSPDGSHLLIITLDGSIIMWNAKDGTQAFRLVGHTDLNTWGEWSPDGTRLLTSNFDGTARVWDAVTGAELLNLFHNANVYNAAWSPNGKQIATAGGDGTIRLWNSITGEELPFVFPLASGQPPQVTPIGAAMKMTSEAQMTQIVPTAIADIVFEKAGEIQVGDNVGEVELLGGQSWTYNGRKGQQITVKVIASGWDAYARIMNPDGSLLIASEFLTSSKDIRFENVLLPMDGEYRIDVASVLGLEKGSYKLIVEAVD